MTDLEKWQVKVAAAIGILIFLGFTDHLMHAGQIKELAKETDSLNRVVSRLQDCSKSMTVLVPGPDGTPVATSICVR